MSNLLSFAEKELNLLNELIKKDGDTCIAEEFFPEILALVKKFGESGQSGGSAPYTAGTICKILKDLLSFTPVTPVMGTDNEWNDVCNDCYQNNRFSAVFKNKDNNKSYYLDAIVWKDQHGCCFSGTARLYDGTKISSHCYIKEFPYTPKTFYVDVVDKLTTDGDIAHFIKDESVMDEIVKYYNLNIITRNKNDW